MRRKQRTLTPPAEVDPPAVYTEPDADIELLGEMVHDTETMERMLLALPFERGHYRSNLRVVLSTARRMVDRCVRLLEEGMDPTAEPGSELWTHRGLPDLSTQIDKQPEASILIDGPAEDTEHDLEDAVAREIQPATADSHPGRNNGRPGPKETGKPPAPKPAPDAEPAGRKREILQLLRKTAMTSGELIKRLEPSGASAQTVYATLTTMRYDGLIDTRNDPLDGQRKNFVK